MNTDLIACTRRARDGAHLLELLHHHGGDASSLVALATSTDVDDLPVLWEALARQPEQAPDDLEPWLDHWLTRGPLDDAEALLSGWPAELDALILTLVRQGHPWTSQPPRGVGVAFALLRGGREIASSWYPDIATGLAARAVADQLPTRCLWPSRASAEVVRDNHGRMTPAFVDAVERALGQAWNDALAALLAAGPTNLTPREAHAAWSSQPAALAATLLSHTISEPEHAQTVELLAHHSPDVLETIARATEDTRPDLASACAVAAGLPSPTWDRWVRLAPWADELEDQALTAVLESLPPARRRAILEAATTRPSWHRTMSRCIAHAPELLPHLLRRLPELSEHPPLARGHVVETLSEAFTHHRAQLVTTFDKQRDPATRAMLSRAWLQHAAQRARQGSPIPADADHLIDVHAHPDGGPFDVVLHEELVPNARQILRHMPARRAEDILLDQLEPSLETAHRALALHMPSPTSLVLEAVAELALSWDVAGSEEERRRRRESLLRWAPELTPYITSPHVAATGQALQSLVPELWETSTDDPVQALVNAASAHAAANPRAATVPWVLVGHGVIHIPLDAVYPPTNPSDALQRLLRALHALPEHLVQRA